MLKITLPQKSSDTPIERRRKMRKKLADSTAENAVRFIANADKFKRGY